MENWSLALAYWEAHVVRRLFSRWREHRQRLLGRALHYWRAAGVRVAFDVWRQVRRATWDGRLTPHPLAQLRRL